jgi:hypothetical protein
MVQGSKKQNRQATVKKTRRVPRMKGGAGIQTIPELKRSFDRLDKDVTEILGSGEKTPAKVKRFQECWRKIFGRPVDKAAAEAYLEVKARSKQRAATTRKNDKQQGGAAALAGAPLDYQTRPGVDGTHGSFLPYVGGKELGFYNTINQEGMFKGCGVENSTPNVPASLGSNLVGGGGVMDDIKTYWSGRVAAASPAPNQNPLKYM